MSTNNPDDEKLENDASQDSPSHISRRKFLLAAGLVGAGLAVGASAVAQTPAQQPGPGAGGAQGDQPPDGTHDNGPGVNSRKTTGAYGSDTPGPGAPSGVPSGPIDGTGDVPVRLLGKTGATVSALGLGGHHLGDASSVNEAMNIVHAALDNAINFFDNCWEYHNGKAEDWLGRALSGGRRQKAVVMTKVCTHGRTAALAMKMLEESLRRLQTDYVDVWQIHAITYDNDPDLAYASGGAIEALDDAKKQGKVRFVGFTGHKDPGLHLRMLEMGYPFDTCQFPLNALDYNFFSFEQQVLPECNRRGIAPLGMKPMGGTANAIKQGLFTAEEMLRYAMSAPVATTITGVDSMDVLNQNLRIARGFTALSADEIDELRQRAAAVAVDGRFEPYKVSIAFDNPWTRMPHGYVIDPTVKEVKDFFSQGIGTPGEIFPTAPFGTP